MNLAISNPLTERIQPYTQDFVQIFDLVSELAEQSAGLSGAEDLRPTVQRDQEQAASTGDNRKESRGTTEQGEGKQPKTVSPTPRPERKAESATVVAGEPISQSIRGSLERANNQSIPVTTALPVKFAVADSSSVARPLSQSMTPISRVAQSQTIGLMSIKSTPAQDSQPRKANRKSTTSTEPIACTFPAPTTGDANVVLMPSDSDGPLSNPSLNSASKPQTAIFGAVLGADSPLQEIADTHSEIGQNSASPTSSESECQTKGEAVQPQESASHVKDVNVEPALPMSLSGPLTSDPDSEKKPRLSFKVSDTEAAASPAQLPQSREVTPTDSPRTNGSAESTIQAPVQAADFTSTVVIPQANHHAAALQSVMVSDAETAPTAKNAPQPDGTASSNVGDDKTTQTSQSVRDAINEMQPQLHVQTGASHEGVSPQSGPRDGNAVLAQAVPAVTTNHVDTPSFHRSLVPANAMRNSAEPADAQATDQPVRTSINAARVIQSMNRSEMRIGIQSAEFGAISIRTSVSQQNVSAAIAVNHSELGKTILAYIPSMREKFGELGFKADVEINQGASSSSGDRHSSSREEQKLIAPALISGEVTSSAREVGATPVTALAAEKDRLDIRA